MKWKNRIGFGGLAGAQSLEPLLHGAAGARDNKVGCNFSEGDKDEGALGEAGMGNFEAGLADDLGAVEKDIEVEGAGTVGELQGAIAAEFALDVEKLLEELARGERGFEGEDGVEEAGLIGEADGGGGVERGAGGDVAEGGKAIGGGGEGGFGRAGGAGEVGAESEVGGGHGEPLVSEGDFRRVDGPYLGVAGEVLLVQREDVSETICLHDGDEARIMDTNATHFVGEHQAPPF